MIATDLVRHLALVVIPVLQVDYQRDVRPILSANCFACHGRDAAHRESELRLDDAGNSADGTDPDNATRDRGGYRAIVPGRPDESELLRRITSEDAQDRMPPAETGKRLTPEQIGKLRRWIEEGARWTKHWSFVPPREVAPPPSRTGSKNKAWPRSPIDRFILARLEEEGLSPATEADRATWLRRVSLALVGLPPTPEEIDRFVADGAADACEKVVDPLLASPAYGERWVRVWLDLARYADTRGYEKDLRRSLWPWRDWLIDALNADRPFDQMTLEMLAGDLLPGATFEQQVATGFHRNTMTNDEGGTDDEEFRVAAVKDRVDTTGLVWLGLTVGCAKCHDHKYDPLSQREYYQLLAFFNQTEDADRGDDAPLLRVPTPEQKAKRRPLDEELIAARAELEAARLRVPAEALRFADQWHAALAQAEASGLLAEPPSCTLGPWRRLPHQTAATYEAAWDSPLPPDPDWQPAADLVDGQVHGIESSPNTAFWFERTLTPGQNAWNAARLELAFGSDDGLVVWLDDAKILERNVMRAAAPDQERITVAIGPGEHRLRCKVVNGGGPAGFFFRVVRDLPAFELPPGGPAVPLAVARVIAKPPEARSAAELEQLAGFVLELAGAPLDEKIAAVEARLAALDPQAPTTLVLRELPLPQQRATHVNVRGDFLNPGDEVAADVPAWLHPFPADAPRNRLGFARWLVDPKNPLTPRVLVNRLWAQMFGVGLVESEEDFGAQGAPPSHPELLDALAVQFVREGWSMKRLLREIALSATFRQSARTTPELLEKDPRNRLLARMPRVRLDAEMVRDQALAASGLLCRRIGGPPVMPPQPEGVWQVVYSGDRWETSPGDERWRRSLYTFIRRTAPYPSMVTFDAPSRETCCVRRIATNTPLQALVTLNDPVFVEAAQALARRVVAEAGPEETARLARACRLVLGRGPTVDETRALLGLLAQRQAAGRADPDAAQVLASRPLGPMAEGTDAATVVELAAWTGVCNVLFNLDEALVRG